MENDMASLQNTLTVSCEVIYALAILPKNHFCVYIYSRKVKIAIHSKLRRPQFDSWVRKIYWRRDRLPTPTFLGFPGGSEGKASACNVGDPGLIPGSARSPGEGNGHPLQDSCLENPMDRGAWQATVHAVVKSRT